MKKHVSLNVLAETVFLRDSISTCFSLSFWQNQINPRIAGIKFLCFKKLEIYRARDGEKSG